MLARALTREGPRAWPRREDRRARVFGSASPPALGGGVSPCLRSTSERAAVSEGAALSRSTAERGRFRRLARRYCFGVTVQRMRDEEAPTEPAHHTATPRSPHRKSRPSSMSRCGGSVANLSEAREPPSRKPSARRSRRCASRPASRRVFPGTAQPRGPSSSRLARPRSSPARARDAYPPRRRPPRRSPRELAATRPTYDPRPSVA